MLITTINRLVQFFGITTGILAGFRLLNDTYAFISVPDFYLDLGTIITAGMMVIIPSTLYKDYPKWVPFIIRLMLIFVLFGRVFVFYSRGR